MDNASTLTAADGFTRLAYTYDQRLAGNPLLLLEAPAVVMALPQVFGKRVADVGCGTGRYAIQLARMGAEAVYGLDLVPDMLEIARSKAQKGDLEFIEWVQADLIEPLPLEDASVDVITASFVLSYLYDITFFFAEAARVLAPGGSLIVGDYHPQYQAIQKMQHEGLYYRFMDEEGDEYRIPLIPHLLSDFFNIARSENLTLSYFAEPVVERDLIANYPLLREMAGIPLTMVLRFDQAESEHVQN